jgi:hypothetical protein
VIDAVTEMLVAGVPFSGGGAAAGESAR